MAPTTFADPPFSPSSLSPAERDALVEELYAVHQQVFAGVDREAFRAYVIEPPAERTQLTLYRDGEGAIVGYLALHLHTVTVGGRRSTVIRGEVGMLRAHRGQSIAWRALAREFVRVLVTRPLRPCYLVATPIHPGSYYALARVNPYVQPRPETAEASAQPLLEAVDAALGLPRPPGAGEHIREVGWITRETAAERTLWSRHPSPLVQFYLSQNPDYAQGRGLRMVCPISAWSVAVGLSGLFRSLLRRRWRAAQARRPALATEGGQ